MGLIPDRGCLGTCGSAFAWWLHRHRLKDWYEDDLCRRRRHVVFHCRFDQRFASARLLSRRQFERLPTGRQNAIVGFLRCTRYALETWASVVDDTFNRGVGRHHCCGAILIARKVVRNGSKTPIVPPTTTVVGHPASRSPSDATNAFR